MSKCVLQPWVLELTYMQQSVLIASVRGPDGIRKEHPSKVLCRWLRRCFLVSAFDGKALNDPVFPGGGSFTGPSLVAHDVDRTPSLVDAQGDPWWYGAMIKRVKDYLKYVDELPHHFQLHFMHAAEILGYKHPDDVIRRFWNTTYNMIVSDAHLLPESEATMDRRLGDSEKQWREAEIVVAKPPMAPTPPPAPKPPMAPKPPWMDKIYKDEDYATIDEWHRQFEICFYRKCTPYTYDGITGFKSMQDALAEVKRRSKTVRIISSSDSRMELGVS